VDEFEEFDGIEDIEDGFDGIEDIEDNLDGPLPELSQAFADLVSSSSHCRYLLIIGWSRN
jgi:hypothetical protein